MQTWFLVHFPKFFGVDLNTDYIENYPVAARWKLQKGHGEGGDVSLIARSYSV